MQKLLMCGVEDNWLITNITLNLIMFVDHKFPYKFLHSETGSHFNQLFQLGFYYSCYSWDFCLLCARQVMIYNMRTVCHATWVAEVTIIVIVVYAVVIVP